MKTISLILIIFSSCFFYSNAQKKDLKIPKNVLYILDGTPIKKSQMGDIKEEDIAEIIVFKGESAKTLYGKKGKNGVIIITTKEGATKMYRKKFSEISQEYSNKIKTISDDNDILYLVNDQAIQDNKEYKLYKLKKKEIIEIVLYNFDETKQKFGIEKKDGSVLIKTR